MKIQKANRRQQRGSRRGFSMIEMLVACSLATLILSINAVWIYHTMRFSSRVSQRHRDHQNLTRLAGDFRDDVRACEKIKIIDQNEVELASPAGDAAAWTSNYKLTETDIFLSRQSAGSQISQERFSLSPNSVIQWDVSELPETISLIVSRDPNKFPDRKSAADQKVDSTSSLPKQSTDPKDLVPLLHLRVSPNRWTIESLSIESGADTETKTKPESKPEPETEPASEAELENKTQPNLSEPSVETIEEEANATK